MRYSERADFDTPTPEELERSRRVWLWLAPVLMLQQARWLFEADGPFERQLLGVALWCALTISILWMLAGWPLRWLSARDRIILNDEGQRAMRAEAMRWGMISAVLLGCAMTIAELWVDLSSSAAINGLVSISIITAAVRFAWLNRGEPTDDE